MNTEINNLVTLFSETANGDNWTGINAEQALKDIPAEKAVKKFHPHHLNIAELTAHLTTWNKVLKRRLSNANFKITAEEDFPVISQLNEEEWAQLKKHFFDSFEELISALRQQENIELEKPFPNGKSSAYRNLHGQVSHLHYHLGQIVLLKKLLV